MSVSTKIDNAASAQRAFQGRNHDAGFTGLKAYDSSGRNVNNTTLDDSLRTIGASGSIQGALPSTKRKVGH